VKTLSFLTDGAYLEMGFRLLLLRFGFTFCVLFVENFLLSQFCFICRLECYSASFDRPLNTDLNNTVIVDG